MTDTPSQSDTPQDPWAAQPTQPRRQKMFNAMPAVVLLLSAAIIGVTAVQLLGPPGLANHMVDIAAVAGGGPYRDIIQPWGPVAPLFLHVFLHGGWLHLFMNMTVMAAFGPAVALGLGRGVRGGALFLAFFFVCAAGGALAQELVYALGDEPGYAIGASSALSGLFAAAGWLRGGFRGALRLSIPWAAINVILAVTELAVGLPIAWAAHLGGLAAGFVLFPLFLNMAGPRRAFGPWG